MKRLFATVIAGLFAVLFITAQNHHVSQHYSIKDGLSQNTVMAILQDQQGYMWFGTWDGLNRFDGYNFEVFKATNNGQEVHVNNRVTLIYEDKAEQLFWETYDGHFFRLSKDRKTICEVAANSLPLDMLQEIEERDVNTKVDSKGVIWQADDANGIMRFRFGRWKRFTPDLDPRYAGRLRKHFFILEDPQGRTWVNPTGGGWSYYDAEKDELVNPFPGLTNMIHTAFIDRNNQMWIATYDGGVDCVDLEPSPYQLHDLRRSPHDNGEVRAFVQKRNGDIIPFIKSQTNVYCALESRHGLLYGTKGNGLKNITTKQVIPTSHPDIYDLEEGPDGTLYVATYGDGVNIIRWNERGTREPAVVVGQGLKVREMELVDDVLWCGTTAGVLRVQLPDMQCLLMPGYDIRAIHYFRDRLWMGSFGGGLLCLDPHAPQPEIQRVETPHDIILSLADDGQHLWFCTENMLAQLEPTTGALFSYDALAGEQNTYFTEAEALRTQDSTLLFGYSDGYCSLYPSRIVHSSVIPPVRITRCEAQDEVLEGDTVTLANGSSVTIEYAAMDFIGVHKIAYSYKMDGVDLDWKEAKDLRRVTYTNLRHGTYIFHVRSTNREGIPVDNEARLLLIVKRPMWLQWWAITLYVLGILLLIGLSFYAVSVYNELRQRVQVEQQVTDIKLRFFTNISHELRTPLTLITGPVTNILQTERINRSVRSQLEIVQSNSRRMLRMVNQLLEFRKVQNQKMKLRVQPTVLSDLIEETCANFQKEADAKHIAFSFENNATDSTVWVDRNRMDTILWNLLSNAFKFTPAGKSIKVIIGEKPGFVTMAVKDEGIGISPEKRNMLFERFSSNNELGGNTNTTGTGIGMNLTKELVDLHHGYIEVDSELGKGTTITILLHTGKDHFGPEVDFITDSWTMPDYLKTQTIEDTLEQIEHGRKDNKRTILVVDDNQDMRQFLSGILCRDYNIEEAADGEEAESTIRKKVIDLVITDIMMPKIDGLELTQFIKKTPEINYIPVILLTAKTAIESRLQALQYGADDYVTKPFEPEYMRARVRNILAQREQLEKSYRQRLMRLEPQKTDEQVPDDTFLAKLLNIIEKQMNNNTLTVDDLVDEMGMGRTVFFNKLKTLTGLSPVEFIREMRLKRAAQLLEDKRYNITEVTYMVGMNDSRYFAKCFKNTYGVTPSEYRHAHLK